MASTTATTPSFRDRENGSPSSTSSIKSAVRSTSESYLSAMSGSAIGGRRNPQSNGGMSPAKMIVREMRASGGGSRMVVDRKDRPDSKLTPSVLSSSVESRRTPSPSLLQPSVLESEVLEEDGEDGDEDRREEGNGDRREDGGWR